VSSSSSTPAIATDAARQVDPPGRRRDRLVERRRDERGLQAIPPEGLVGPPRVGGREEQRRRDLVALEHRPRVLQEVAVAVVEGDHHGAGGHAALAAPDRQHVVERQERAPPREVGHLALEVGRARADQPGIERRSALGLVDPVVHERDQQVLRARVEPVEQAHEPREAPAARRGRGEVPGRAPAPRHGPPPGQRDLVGRRLQGDARREGQG
jgi:hypothetical protein